MLCCCCCCSCCPWRKALYVLERIAYLKPKELKKQKESYVSEWSLALWIVSFIRWENEYLLECWFILVYCFLLNTRQGSPSASSHSILNHLTMQTKHFSVELNDVINVFMFILFLVCKIIYCNQDVPHYLIPFLKNNNSWKPTSSIRSNS